MPKKWNVCSPDLHQQAELAKLFNIHPIIAQLLINRSITDEQQAQPFLNCDLAQLDDPMKMKDMDRAVERIRQAKSNNEKVMIFGDYDVDGVTSSAVLRRLFYTLGIDAINHIPHRMEEGYGLNKEIAQVAKEAGVALILTVDCGINAFEEVDAINQAGIDVIILDHHTPDANRLPKAVAVVDPKREDCPYPFKEFAAVGLAAKLSQAILGEIPKDDLDLIAIGTIADMVPLRGENRIFAKYGLQQLSRTKKPGLVALLEKAKVKDKPMKPYYIGFILGPRINAAGRIGSAASALELMLCEDSDEAAALAQVLETYNQKRQRLQQDVVQEAIDTIEATEHHNDNVLVVHKDGWHKGVVGIVASRIKDKFNKPSIVISCEDGVGVGSARSFGNFHLYEALDHCAPHLEAYGGHKQAAGLTVRHENIEQFKMAINAFAKDILTHDDLVPVLDIDCEVPLNQWTMDLHETIESLQPFGQGNPSPIFCSRELTVKSGPQTLGRGTLKFWVTDGKVTYSVVGFGMAEEFAPHLKMGQKVDIAYELAIDDWNKAPTLQLMLKDISACL